MRSRTLKVAIVWTLMSAFLPTAFGFETGGKFQSCADPEDRRSMTLLQSAISGPRYASYDHSRAKARFDENFRLAQMHSVVSEGFDQSTGLPSEPEDYLKALDKTTLRLMTAAVIEMMWAAYEPSELKGSVYRVEADELHRFAVQQICVSSCSPQMRRELLIEAKSIAAKIQASGEPRRTFAKLSDEFNMNLRGLKQILSAQKTSFIESADYWQLLTSLSLSGTGRLWQMSAVRKQTSIPYTADAVNCFFVKDESKACRVSEADEFSAALIKSALSEYYSRFQYRLMKRVSDRSKSLASDRAVAVEREIVEYYRYFPMSVVTVSIEQPRFKKFHCKYLAMSLATRGEQLSFSVDVREVSRLAPMGVFWLVGLGAGMFNKGRVSPLAFSIASGLQIVDVFVKTSELKNQIEDLEKARLAIQAGGVDLEVLQRYFQSLQLTQELTADRDQLIGEQIAMAVLAFTGARIFVHGFRGAFAGKLTAEAVAKRRYFGEGLDAYLAKRRIYSSVELAAYLKSASPAELSKIKNMMKSGYEFTLPALIVSLKDVWSTFTAPPTDYRAMEQGL